MRKNHAGTWQQWYCLSNVHSALIFSPVTVCDRTALYQQPNHTLLKNNYHLSKTKQTFIKMQRKFLQISNSMNVVIEKIIRFFVTIFSNSVS